MDAADRNGTNDGEDYFADGTPMPDGPADGQALGQAQALVQMAEDTYRLIRSTDGRTFAVPRLGPAIALPLSGKNGVRIKLSASLRRRTGKVANASALSDCITVLEGEAAELDPQPVHLRVARHCEAIVIDMSTETGQCIIITPHGWAVEADSPVIFRRSALSHPLPAPARPASLEGLRELINLPEEEYRLAIGWVVAACFPAIPHPILLIQGEHGTAKTTLIRSLLALVDPQPAAERHAPENQREWAIFARASWAFCFDNITEIPAWLSNALCKGVTGDAVLQRALHSDEDIVVFAFQRVMALTTVAIRHDLASDLADRMLLVEPEFIEQRLTEAEVDARRQATLPAALAAVLDLAAAVLRELPAVTVEDAPRMADFARVLAAVDAVTGWDTLGTYRAKVTAMSLTLIEGSTLARALYKLATARTPGGLDPTPWEGTATELLAALRRTCQQHGLATAELPTDERVLGRQVREIAPNLRRAGVDIRAGRSNKRRALLIRRDGKIDNAADLTTQEEDPPLSS